jgi:CBS domain-containing protein
MLRGDDVVRLDPDDELVDALAELSERGSGRGLVVDGDRLVGLLSASDLARALETRRARRRPPGRATAPRRV